MSAVHSSSSSPSLLSPTPALVSQFISLSNDLQHLKTSGCKNSDLSYICLHRLQSQEIKQKFWENTKENNTISASSSSSLPSLFFSLLSSSSSSSLSSSSVNFPVLSHLYSCAVLLTTEQITNQNQYIQNKKWNSGNGSKTSASGSMKMGNQGGRNRTSSTESSDLKLDSSFFSPQFRSCPSFLSSFSQAVPNASTLVLSIPNHLRSLVFSQTTSSFNFSLSPRIAPQLELALISWMEWLLVIQTDRNIMKQLESCEELKEAMVLVTRYVLANSWGGTGRGAGGRGNHRSNDLLVSRWIEAVLLFYARSLKQDKDQSVITPSLVLLLQHVFSNLDLLLSQSISAPISPIIDLFLHHLRHLELFLRSSSSSSASFSFLNHLPCLSPLLLTIIGSQATQSSSDHSCQIIAIYTFEHVNMLKQWMKSTQQTKASWFQSQSKDVQIIQFPIPVKLTRSSPFVSCFSTSFTSSSSTSLSRFLYGTASNLESSVSCLFTPSWFDQVQIEFIKCTKNVLAFNRNNDEQKVTTTLIHSLRDILVNSINVKSIVKPSQNELDEEDHKGDVDSKLLSMIVLVLIDFYTQSPHPYLDGVSRVDQLFDLVQQFHLSLSSTSSSIFSRQLLRLYEAAFLCLDDLEQELTQAIRNPSGTKQTAETGASSHGVDRSIHSSESVERQFVPSHPPSDSRPAHLYSASRPTSSIRRRTSASSSPPTRSDLVTLSHLDLLLNQINQVINRQQSLLTQLRNQSKVGGDAEVEVAAHALQQLRKSCDWIEQIQRQLYPIRTRNLQQEQQQQHQYSRANIPEQKESTTQDGEVSSLSASVTSPLPPLVHPHPYPQPRPSMTSSLPSAPVVSSSLFVASRLLIPSRPISAKTSILAQQGKVQHVFEQKEPSQADGGLATSISPAFMISPRTQRSRKKVTQGVESTTSALILPAL